MALEKSLWQRCKNGVKHLKDCGHAVHFCRVENDAGEGHPDVEGVLNGDQCWIELKSNARPKRSTTAIRSKTRESQSIWHNDRTKAGSRIHWVLIQVGEAHAAKLYLIPGSNYDEVIATEAVLAHLSVVEPDASVPEVLLRACEGW
jgi:hypothetical protein